MYDRILVGIDGSAHATHAVDHAIAVAKSFGAVLRVVHVLDTGWLPLAPELGVDIAPLTAARRDHAETWMASAVEKARAAGLSAEWSIVETQMPTQQPAEVLLAEASSWRADAIVLGVRGHSGLQRLLVGSMADGVLRRSSVPVVLVP